MDTLFTIFLGAGIGGVLRYLLVNAVTRLAPGPLPYGTLTVNLLGGLILGFLVEYWVLHSSPSPLMRALLVTGMLGGFTTFSAFTLETVNLLERQENTLALAYIAASVAGSVLALAFGMVLARQIG